MKPYNHISRNLLLLALAATAAACSKSGHDPEPLPRDNERRGVGFVAQIEGLEATRAGITGEIDELRLQGLGFGVFATRTDGLTYAQALAATKAAPNFMYNQQVYYQLNQWVYEPEKYWPNENQPADDSGATGVNLEHSYVSFFAYAPWVAVDKDSGFPTSGSATSGITRLTAADVYGDPKVSYALAPTADDQVDLLWGKRGKASYAEADGMNNTDPAPVNTDLTKQIVTERVSFLFHHALCCVDVYVRRIFDEVTPSGKKAALEDTHIYVNRLQLRVPADGLRTAADLNLHTGDWTATARNAAPVDFTTTENAIVYDLQGTARPNTDLATVQTMELDNFAAKAGATEELKRLTASYVTLLIPDPTAGITLTPTISYSFVTRDPSLILDLPSSDASALYHRIQHTVTGAPVVIGTEYEEAGVKKYRLEPGKRYILVCSIGVESVQFEVASVQDWDFPLRFEPTVDLLKDKEITHQVDEE